MSIITVFGKVITKAGLKLMARSAAKTSTKVVAKTATKTIAKTSLKSAAKFLTKTPLRGAFLGIGAVSLGAVGLSALTGNDTVNNIWHTITEIWDKVNPFASTENLITFVVVGVIIIAFVGIFKSRGR